MDKELFKKYHNRVVREGVLKALFCGVICGAASAAVVALICWYVGFKAGLFLSVGVFVAAVAAAAPAFYFLKFRPTAKQIARRVDELGLEERLLTMLELEGDDSYIAQAQRKDAVRALGTVDHMLIKIAVSASLIIALCVAGVVGVGGVTVSALYYAGVIPSGHTALTPAQEIRSFRVVYKIDGDGGLIVKWSPEGKVDGESLLVGETEEFQKSAAEYTVNEGESLEAVYALPIDDTFVFVGWSDGWKSPYRCDENISANITVSAIFEPLDEYLADEAEAAEGESESESDQPPEDAPEEESSSSEPEQEPNGDPNPEGQDGSGLTDESNRQIIDGQTYYGDEYATGRQDAMDRLSQDREIPDDIKEYIEDYFDAIETDSKSDDDED